MSKAMAEAYLSAAKKARGAKPQHFASGGEVEDDACPHCGAEMGGVDSVERITNSQESSQLKMDAYQRRKALYDKAIGGK